MIGIEAAVGAGKLGATAVEAAAGVGERATAADGTTEAGRGAEISIIIIVAGALNV